MAWDSTLTVEEVFDQLEKGTAFSPRSFNALAIILSSITWLAVKVGPPWSQVLGNCQSINPSVISVHFPFCKFLPLSFSGWTFLLTFLPLSTRVGLLVKQTLVLYYSHRMTGTPKGTSCTRSTNFSFLHVKTSTFCLAAFSKHIKGEH